MDAPWWNGAPDADDDPGTVGRGAGPSYVCVDCDWRGKHPLHHYLGTGHAVRGQAWPAHMGNCLWTDSDRDGRRTA